MYYYTLDRPIGERVRPIPGTRIGFFNLENDDVLYTAGE